MALDVLNASSAPCLNHPGSKQRIVAWIIARSSFSLLLIAIFLAFFFSQPTLSIV